MQTLFDSISDPQGFIQPKMAAEHFHTVVPDILAMSGVPLSAATKLDRIKSGTNQSRLKSVMEIINQVKPWAGSDLKAYAWYRSEPIHAFGNQTPEAMVKSGHAQAVRDYLDAIAAGGFA